MSALPISKWKRRLLLSGAAAGLGAALLRPSETGARHNGYFALMAGALRDAGIATPTLVIDKTRLFANQEVVRKHLASNKQAMALRLVAKSLPSLALLDYLMQSLSTQRLMLFNLPYLQLCAQQRPRSDILLGKPMPVAAAAQFYREFKSLGNAPAFVPEKQLQWLIDSPARLAQYRDLASSLNIQMRINLEIDVGLHRGGFADAASLQAALDILKNAPQLHYAGMMGYDAHIPKIPDMFGSQAKALAYAKETYATFALQAKNTFGAQANCFNAAGSPTYRLHDGTGAANEVALGSAFVKPSDFDLPLLADLQAACYIATPVLKADKAFQMPKGVETLSDLVKLWDVNSRQAYFVYGGNWLADPISPQGISNSSLYGSSSNQQILLGSGRQGLQADDMVFFRPRQSEAVLQQFGAIAVVEMGRVVDRWDVFPAQA